MIHPPVDAAGGLYEMVDRMTLAFGAKPLGECSGRQAWPARGVYFFLDQKEPSPFGGALGRLVRVGTHGLTSRSSSTLWGRLRQHKGQANGNGNHRGSVFRKHVGSALLTREGTTHPTWGVGSSASRAVRLAERDQEERVTRYLASLLVTYVPILDEPGAASLRGYVERNSIGALTAGRGPGSQPSQQWLGLWAPSSAIRASGLWNVRHVGEAVEPNFLEVLDRLVRS